MTSIGITPKYEKEAEKFYVEVLELFKKTDFQFLMGGTYAVKHYTGIDRPTKDLDIFCKAGDYPKILKFFSDQKYNVGVEDDRWLARIYKDEFFVDIIFGSIPGMWPITDEWMEKAQKGKILGFDVKITPPEELIVSKAYRMKRSEFDGADVTHIILKCADSLDWKHLLNRLEPNWELLFIHVILFRFTYPSERDIIPRWLIDELLSRVHAQLDIPSPKDKVTRGSMLSQHQYRIAIEKWGYKDITEFTFPQK